MEDQQLADKLIQWRRFFHAHPELSFLEYETSREVSKILGKIEGMKVETGIAGTTGVVGTLSNGEGPTVLLRADMDALPIAEKSGCTYRSQYEGVMHACGHDAHTAILLGVAHILADQFKNGQLKGTVRLLFQPAEEAPDEGGETGAPKMIDSGVLVDVDAAVALHMCPWKSVGEIQVNDGYSMASVDVFHGVIYGSGGHGAYPHLGTDPVWMLGPVLQALYGIIPRRISPLEPAVISVGRISAGTASNVIPSEVEVEGTMRSYDPEVREMAIQEVERAFSVVNPLGGNYSLQVIRGEPALYNHSEVNQQIVAAIHELFPDFTIDQAPFGLGGEDFAHITGKVPGAMFFLGCALPDGKQRDLHSETFDLDERCLSVGAKILSATACRYLS